MSSDAGVFRNFSFSLDTVNAAANAIAAADNRLPHPPSPQKQRWKSYWGSLWCFGAQKQNKQVRHDVFLPQRTESFMSAGNSVQSYGVVLPFVAPPSSPVSVLQSEPPSAVQSPAGLLSFSCRSGGMFSPDGLIFATGPYSNDTQLVSPPVFSAFTTQPSTAPLTPPPESIQLMTTPPSPEVPFAELLGLVPLAKPSHGASPFSGSEFQSYYLQPGSPIGQLISPSSVMSGSGTLSPLTGPPKLLNLEKLAAQKWRSWQGSGSLTPEPAIVTVDHRVSFEVTMGDILQCLAKKNHEEDGSQKNQKQITDGVKEEDEEEREGPDQQTQRSGKEFKFNNGDPQNSCIHSISCNWWADEKVLDESPFSCKEWSFFPMIQPRVS